MKANLFILLFFFSLPFSNAQDQTYKFNTQIIFEVDGKPNSKKLFYESSFQIIDDKTIIWIYHSPLHNDQRYSKFHIQKKYIQNRNGLDVIVYNVIEDSNLKDCVIIKGSGVVNGETKEMFEVWMNIEENPKPNIDFDFKMRFVNE